MYISSKKHTSDRLQMQVAALYSSVVITERTLASMSLAMAQHFRPVLERVIEALLQTYQLRSTVSPFPEALQRYYQSLSCRCQVMRTGQG